jgi:hypothetical protein
MNPYIELDGKKYAAIHGQWAPATHRPVVVRRLLSGNTNVTFGPASNKRWQGKLTAAISPGTGYGSINNLRTTYEKLEALTFVDHYGVTHSVIIDRTVNEASNVPMWDSPENKIQVNLTLVKL